MNAVVKNAVMTTQDHSDKVLVRELNIANDVCLQTQYQYESPGRANSLFSYSARLRDLVSTIADKSQSPSFPIRLYALARLLSYCYRQDLSILTGTTALNSFPDLRSWDLPSDLVRDRVLPRKLEIAAVFCLRGMHARWLRSATLKDLANLHDYNSPWGNFDYENPHTQYYLIFYFDCFVQRACRRFDFDPTKPVEQNDWGFPCFKNRLSRNDLVVHSDLNLSSLSGEGGINTYKNNERKEVKKGKKRVQTCPKADWSCRMQVQSTNQYKDISHITLAQATAASGEALFNSQLLLAGERQVYSTRFDVSVHHQINCAQNKNERPLSPLTISGLSVVLIVTTPYSFVSTWSLSGVTDLLASLTWPGQVNMQTTRVMYAGPSEEISVDLTNKQYSVLQLSDSELQPLARSGPSEEISVDLTNKQYSVLQLSDSELQPLARSGPSEEISVDLTNKQYSVLQLSDSELQPLARSGPSEEISVDLTNEQYSVLQLSDSELQPLARSGPSEEISVDLTNKQYSVLQLSDSELQPLARSGPSEEISVDLTNKQYSVLQLSDSELQPLARSGPSEEISVDLTNKQYSVLQLSDSELQPLARSGKMQTTRVMYAGPSEEISVDLTNKQYSVLQLSDSELQPLARSGPSEEISVDLTNKQYSVLQLSDSELQPLARSGPSEEISVDLTNKQYSVLQLSDSELQPLARSGKYADDTGNVCRAEWGDIGGFNKQAVLSATTI
ncbi:hypothetical protein J6590_049242 [Homalodisca vitripennis]|nr:hypothetical protein J6590_049242 [Homalodisca vitripennis]